jgi:hypothetical protein
MALPNDLRQGTSVTILNTGNVSERFPEIVGCQATIDKVPVHPSTWFTIRVNADQRIVKLQSTALKAVKTASKQGEGQNEAPPKNRFLKYIFSPYQQFLLFWRYLCFERAMQYISNPFNQI